MSIKWARKTEWGYDSSTYSAKQSGWKFHIGKGDLWVLRGWGPDNGFMYRPCPSLWAAKVLAADFVATLDGAE